MRRQFALTRRGPRRANNRTLDLTAGQYSRLWKRGYLTEKPIRSSQRVFPLGCGQTNFCLMQWNKFGSADELLRRVDRNLLAHIQTEIFRLIQSNFSQCIVSFYTRWEKLCDKNRDRTDIFDRDSIEFYVRWEVSALNFFLSVYPTKRRYGSIWPILIVLWLGMKTGCNSIGNIRLIIPYRVISLGAVAPAPRKTVC